MLLNRAALRYNLRMAARLGIVLYWIGVILALSLCGVGVLVLLGQTPGWSVIFFVPAVAVSGKELRARIMSA